MSIYAAIRGVSEQWEEYPIQIWSDTNRQLFATCESAAASMPIFNSGWRLLIHGEEFEWPDMNVLTTGEAKEYLESCFEIWQSFYDGY